MGAGLYLRNRWRGDPRLLAKVRQDVEKFMREGDIEVRLDEIRAYDKAMHSSLESIVDRNVMIQSVS